MFTYKVAQPFQVSHFCAVSFINILNAKHKHKNMYFPSFFLQRFMFLHLNFCTTLYDNHNRIEVKRIKNKLG